MAIPCGAFALRLSLIHIYSAFEAIDALAAIDTPDAMKDLQTNYVDGCNKLKDALNSYIDLYTEISSRCV